MSVETSTCTLEIGSIFHYHVRLCLDCNAGTAESAYNTVNKKFWKNEHSSLKQMVYSFSLMLEVRNILQGGCDWHHISEQIDEILYREFL